MAEIIDCSICFEELNNEEEYVLNCNHKYHRDCISRWLHTNPTCPLCRQPVDADPRYVQDEIMSEERRLQIEELEKILLLSARGLEWLFPEQLNIEGESFTGQFKTALETNDGKKVLNDLSDYFENNESTLYKTAQAALRFYNWLYPNTESEPNQSQENPE